MGSFNKHTRSPGYKPGNHWLECQRCGMHIRSKDAKKTWDGLIVCPEDWEARHPQDFVRAVQDDSSAKGLVVSETEDVEIIPNCTTRSGVAGIAIAGCAIAGFDSLDDYTIPTGTFSGSPL